MKKFIYNLTKFLLPLIVLIISFPTIDSIIINKSISTNTKLIILGDSHTQTGLLASKIPNCINISQSSEVYFFTYNKLVKISQITKIDTIFLSYSPHNISYFQDVKLLGLQKKERSLELYSRYWNILDNKSKRFLYEKSKISIIKFINPYIKKNISNFIKLKSPIINSYTYSKKNKLDINKTNNKINIHFYKSKNKLYSFDKYQKEYIKKIIDYCHKQKIELILINLPVHRSYKKQIPKQFILEYYNRIEKYKINNTKYIDFSNIKLADSLFGDGDHLNYYGAKKITDLLLKTIRK